jgi:hypothetical protein
MIRNVTKGLGLGRTQHESPYGRFTEINSKTVACQSKGKQKKNEGV